MMMMMKLIFQSHNKCKISFYDRSIKTTSSASIKLVHTTRTKNSELKDNKTELLSTRINTQQTTCQSVDDDETNISKP